MQAHAGGPSEPPIVDDQQPSQGGASPAAPSSPAGGRSFQGTPLDSSEGPNPRTSPEDEQKTGGVGQQVRLSGGRWGGRSEQSLHHAVVNAAPQNHGGNRHDMLLTLPQHPTPNSLQGPASYRPSHATGGEGREFEEVKK